MQYVIAFLEGIITFISPCLLPMPPIYISYFTGGEQSTKRTIKGAFRLCVRIYSYICAAWRIGRNCRKLFKRISDGCEYCFRRHCYIFWPEFFGYT